LPSISAWRHQQPLFKVNNVHDSRIAEIGLI
jgi:hypothetical protein